MKPSRHFPLAVLAVLLAGCERDHYEIAIRPDGQGFRRQLTCWHVSGTKDEKIRPLASAELARIAKLYPERLTPEGAAKQSFAGQFRDTTPSDVGGAGTYLHFESPLGTASSYVERFRGRDDLESQLAVRRQAADQLADLLAGWLKAELGNDPGFPALNTFVERDLRRDLENVGVYAWTGAAMPGGPDASRGEFLVRVGLYLVERGYARPSELPALSCAVARVDVPAILAHVQRFLARKMGVPDERPIPKSLDFAADPERLLKSFDKYARTTELFQKRLARWKAREKKDSQHKEPTPEQMVADLLARTVTGHDFQLVLGSPGDSLDLTLHCASKPYSTNGTWDAALAAVRWSEALDPGRSLPVVCFAFWSTPNRAFQEEHFGRVVLAGGDLAKYAVWYRSLKPDETAEWDRFVARLKPGERLVPAVEAFRFSSDPKPAPGAGDRPPASLADTPREVILERLKKAEPAAPR